MGNEALIDISDADFAGEGGGARGSVPGAQALLKGLGLIAVIGDAPQPMRFNDLLRVSGLSKGTLHRMLQALVDFRFVRFEDTSATYHLGHRLFEMAHKVWSGFDLRGAAEPELERLLSLTNETTRLGIFDEGDVLVIDQREFVQPMRLANGVGSRLSARASAIGKVILAYASPEMLQGILTGSQPEALTPNTILDIQELRRELDLTKARGYAISVEEQHVGISAVAAPILNHLGEAIGAIAVCGPSFRLPVDRLHALGTDVIESARRVAGNYGETFMSISNSVGPVIGIEPNLECVVPSSAFLGESPFWLAGSKNVLWVDILAPAVHLSSPFDGQTTTVPLNELVGVVVPRRKGGYIAATQTGFRALDIQTGDMSTLAVPKGMVGNRFNDGKCDPAGRLWAGTIALDASPDKGALYRMDLDGSVTQMDSGFHICNGLGWSPDGTKFYFTDSGRRIIYVYDFDVATGSIANRREFVSFGQTDGVPDGLAVDAEGALWCAMWDGWAVRRYLADGRLDRTVALPVPRPTSCVFGGDNLQTLYVTSARIRLSSMQLAAAPLSGSVFALKTDVAGTPVSDFRG